MHFPSVFVIFKKFFNIVFKKSPREGMRTRHPLVDTLTTKLYKPQHVPKGLMHAASFSVNSCVCQFCCV